MTEPNIAAELEKVGETLRLYAKALSGREIYLASYTAAASRGAGWASPGDDGKAVTVRLPARIDRFPTEKENFTWYKVILTHQSGHLEFATFDFRFDRPSRCFDDWRPRLAPENVLQDAPSEWAKLWQLFPDPQLGWVIFEQLEDARIDARLLNAYPGIRPVYRRVADAVLATRPRLSWLPLREAFVEALVQMGLAGNALREGPDALTSEIETGWNLLNTLRRPDATVEDSAEATLRLYEIAAQLPNKRNDECADDHHAPRPRPKDAQAPDSLMEPATDDDDLPLTPPREVEFRLDDVSQRRPPSDREPKKNDSDQQPLEVANRKDPGGPLTRDEPFCYLYPEWDFRNARYLRSWCRVRERVMDEGTSDFYSETLAEHRPLVAQITSRFEHFLPELFRKMTGRYDGEDIDLDGAIERFVDRRTGAMPAEKIYWRRERTQRDVAVALLIDMSATTQEFVQLAAAQAYRPTGPGAQAYSEYLKRLASGVDARGKPLRRRTIDIEKQASIVLCQALEKIGDSYALYAFSGSGRAEVEFHVIKDFPAPLTQRIARRIDRIQPAHGTRMGAAIRHTLRKLERVEANTKLLFLLSDGRPYDRDYGRGDEDQEYAAQDTRQALLEAKRRRVRPFCLTIDRDGEDYLRRMCDEIPYEVVTQVEELPIRMVAAYPKLTAK